jgi:hypothetical protein
MDLKRLRDNLYSDIEARVKEFGFRGNKAARAYFKNIPGGRLGFYLALINHQEDFDATVHLGIRFDAVEDLVAGSQPNKNTSTMGGELGNLTQGSQRRWSVASPDDVPVVAASIVEAFKQHALPYYERYSDQRAAFEALSKTDRSAWLHMPFHNVRAMHAVALAILLKMNGGIKELIEEHDRYLVYLNDPDIETFRKFVAPYR